jgi:hypothetical protein
MELWHDFGNRAAARNAGWREILKVAPFLKWVDADQESPSNALGEYLTSLSENWGSFGEEENMPNRGDLAGLKAPCEFFADELDRRRESTPESHGTNLPVNHRSDANNLPHPSEAPTTQR